MTAFLDQIRDDAVFRTVFSLLSSIVLYLFGGFYVPVVVLALMMVLDFLTKMHMLAKKAGGLRQARRTGLLSSRAAYRKTFNKIFRYTIVIILGNLLSYMVPPTWSYKQFFLGDVLRYYIWFQLGVIEFTSVLENLDGVEHKEKARLKDYFDFSFIFRTKR